LNFFLLVAVAVQETVATATLSPKRSRAVQAVAVAE
jgi:hypothetical protein